MSLARERVHPGQPGLISSDHGPTCLVKVYPNSSPYIEAEQPSLKCWAGCSLLKAGSGHCRRTGRDAAACSHWAGRRTKAGCAAVAVVMQTAVTDCSCSCVTYNTMSSVQHCMGWEWGGGTAWHSAAEDFSWCSIIFNRRVLWPLYDEGSLPIIPHTVNIMHDLLVLLAKTIPESKLSMCAESLIKRERYLIGANRASDLLESLCVRLVYWSA